MYESTIYNQITIDHAQISYISPIKKVTLSAVSHLIKCTRAMLIQTQILHSVALS